MLSFLFLINGSSMHHGDTWSVASLVTTSDLDQVNACMHA